MKPIYYAARMYNTLNPTIVESFDNAMLAHRYCDVMNQADKGTYKVLVLWVEGMQVSYNTLNSEVSSDKLPQLAAE